MQILIWSTYNKRESKGNMYPLRIKLSKQYDTEFLHWIGKYYIEQRRRHIIEYMWIYVHFKWIEK